jgi:hypothetical protein
MLETNITLWLVSICMIAAFGVIGFSWERMRRQLNQALPSEQKITLYPPLPQRFGELVWKTNDLGHFVTVLDQYTKTHPLSPLPKKVAIALVGWIICFMGLLASGVGR